MIVNDQLMIQYLANWLAMYAKNNGKSVFVVNKRSHNRSDDLVLHLCNEGTKVFGGLKTEIYEGRNDSASFIECLQIANKSNGIVVGSVSRTFGLYHRSFDKLTDGLADVYPLFDLEYSEIVELTKDNIEEYHDFEDYKMVEFCNSAELIYGIITDIVAPSRHARWPYFTQEQKKWIGIVHQREKKTRHKKITKPFTSVSDKPNLCRRVAQ